MFLKSFKRTLSLFVAVVFILSLVPTVGMAEMVTTDPAIPMINIVNTRGDKPGEGNQIAFPNTLRVQNGNTGSNADWHVYAQFDLSDYQEILTNEKTKVTFGVKVGGNTSGNQTQRDFKIYLMNDNCDYFTEDIKYADAALLGLHDPETKGQLIAEVASDGIYNRFDVYSVDIPTDKLTEVLRQGKNNSLITLVFTTTETSNATCFIRDSATLTITYDDTDIDARNAAYTQEIADGINWSDLSTELQTAVTKNLTLPTKLYGADINWTSDNNAINSAGEVTQSNKKQNVTLSANVSYKGAVASTPAEFDITVDKLIYNYTDIYNGSNSGFVSIKSSDLQYITVDYDVKGVAGKTTVDGAYNIHDLVAKDKYLNYVFTNNDENQRDDIMEFSICLPTGTETVGFEATILDNTDAATGGSVQKTLSYNITKDGLYSGNTRLYETKQNEWYNISLVAPKGIDNAGTENDTDDKTCTLYVNGELVDRITCNKPTYYGFRTLRFYGFDDVITEPGYYLDNMRLYSGDYKPSYDKIPSVTSSAYSIKNNTIALPGNADVTAAELKAAVAGDEDTVLRLYSAKTNMTAELVADAEVSEGAVLVAASTNGTNLEKGYSYYTIEKLDYAIEADILVNGVPASEFGDEDVVSVSVKFDNYCLGTQDIKLYVAQYKGNELIGLWQDDANIADGASDTLSPVMTDFENDKDSTLKLILVTSNTLKPYIKPVTAQYAAAE